MRHHKSTTLAALYQIDSAHLPVCSTLISSSLRSFILWTNRHGLHLLQLFKNIRVWGSVFVGLMVLIAVFLIRNTIKMTILVRKDEIAIMRTVGAYNWYISLPFVLEGIFIGFWGALCPVLICIFGYTGLYHVMNGMFFSDMMSMLKPYPFVLCTSGGILLIGMVVGMLGSYLAVRKYLRWTR